MVRRAGIEGEEGVTVSFGFKSLMSSLIVGVLDALPYIGEVFTILTFRVHRIVLITDQHAYVFRAKMFHRPGKVLGTYEVGPGTVERVRGKLTFSDGVVVWHSPLFKRRAVLIEEAANAESAHVAVAA
jgi:hypothetical protein